VRLVVVATTETMVHPSGRAAGTTLGAFTSTTSPWAILASGSMHSNWNCDYQRRYPAFRPGAGAQAASHSRVRDEVRSFGKMEANSVCGVEETYKSGIEQHGFGDTALSQQS
jgi:hypothetical protein